MDEFQKRLVNELERNNITQKQLALKTGITAATISRYVSGHRKPTAENALKIANILGVSADYLFGSIAHQESVKRAEKIDKTEKDVSKTLEELKNDLESQSGLLFSGGELDEETREFLLASLERTIRQSKVLAKEKFTPHKYKK